MKKEQCRASMKGSAHAYGGRGGRGKLMARRKQVNRLPITFKTGGFPRFFSDGIDLGTIEPTTPTAQSMSTPSKIGPARSTATSSICTCTSASQAGSHALVFLSNQSPA